MQSSGNHTYHFGQALLNELIEFGTSHFAGLPCSVVFVVVVFLLDTTLRSSTAKLYFVCGYGIEFLLFYAFSVICFPRNRETSGTGTTPKTFGSRGRSSFVHSYDDDDDDVLFQRGGDGAGGRSDLLTRVGFLARPFQVFTEASFFNFSAGYVLGYWGNLNILTETPNAMVVNAYYAAFVLLCYLFSVFYLSNVTSWSSALVSVVVGVIGGMLCSSLVASRVKLETAYDNQFITSDDDAGGTNSTRSTNSTSGVTMCDGDNDDMVCQVFRASG